MYKPDMLPAVPPLPGGLGALPGALGANPVQSKLAALFTQGGIPMSKPALIGLTAFPSTGYLGINLFALEQKMSGSLKALTYILGILLSFYTQSYMSSIPAKIVKWILLFAPPWYVYDIIQVIDSKFSGFKNPIKDFEPGKPTTGTWILTISLISLILGTLSASVAAAILNSPLTQMIFPQGITSQYVSIATYGTSSSLIGIGLMGLLFSEDTPGNTTISSGAPLVPPVPTPGQLAEGAIGALRQAGGGMSLPPLSSFLKYKKSANIHESTTFLSLLGIIFIGGILLSTLRANG
jgi:hypothetical protein